MSETGEGFWVARPYGTTSAMIGSPSGGPRGGLGLLNYATERGSLLAGCARFRVQGFSERITGDSPVPSRPVGPGRIGNCFCLKKGDDLLGFLPQRRLDGVLHQLPGVLQREFFFEVALVGFNSLDTQMKFFGDLAS